MINRVELKTLAKEQIRGNIGILILIVILLNLLVALGMIGVIIGAFLIAPAFSISHARIYLNLTNGRRPEVKEIFSGFDIFGKALWLEIITGFFTFLWFIIPVAGLVLGFIKTISYCMGLYILAENPQMTAREALNESKRIMDGHKMDWFVLKLSFIPWGLLCIVTLGLANIYAYPYQCATETNFYNTIKGAGAQSTGNYGGAPSYDGANVPAIVGTSGSYSGVEFPVPFGEEIILGRDAALAHIVITQDSEKVSRQHCSVSFDLNTQMYTVIDFSSNGTYQNDGTKLAANVPVRLPRGSVIYLAKPTNSFMLS
ncbi:MAG: DUF975 family protein [Clostridiales Family XIII bacterium]|nr:DUF975 family protein [Clostridiales Family XIII bacterium]